MANKVSRIYQFKVSLEGVRPKIWRRIQVPEKYSFADLHTAIQNAMGWENYHLYQFIMLDIEGIDNITIGTNDCDEMAARTKISDYFLSLNTKAIYEYDFGDCWMHTILLEKIIDEADSTKYPQCIGGKRACPPEDCGGVYGYQEFLKILKKPGSIKYKEQMEWIGDEFDSELFDPKEIIF